MHKELQNSSLTQTFLNHDRILRDFFESAPALMGVVELEGDVLRHILDNHKAAGDPGIERKKLDVWIKQYRKSEKLNQPVTFEYQHFDTILSVKVSFIEKTETGASRFSYVAQDVTELRSAIRDQNESVQEIADTLPQIIWLARPDGYVYWYNDWFYKFTGLSRESEVTTPIHPEDKEAFRAKIQHSLATGESTYHHFRIRRADGEYRWHVSRGVAVKDTEGNIVRWIGSNTDTHENLILFEKLKEEQEARERFVATLSHDLRTPLTAAKMSAQIISRKVTDVDVVTRSAARIVENINRADIMIRDILDANRIKAGEKIALDYGNCHLRTIISDALDDLRTLHGDRFILEDGSDVEGYWSCTGIRRILENLCNNAIKYGSPHENVTITLKDESDHILLMVHNLGNPIPPGDQKKLFEPYRRADNAEVTKQRGWGLGLTLIKGIAEAHGGHVTVASSPENGTTFTVFLPKRAKSS